MVVFRPPYSERSCPFGAHASTLQVVNIGAGPALDLRFRLADVRPDWDVYLQAELDAPPPALGAGEAPHAVLRIRSPDEVGFVWVDPSGPRALLPSKVGVVQASYSDVYGQYFRSEAELFYNEPAEEDGGRYGFSLRPLVTSRPGGYEEWGA